MSTSSARVLVPIGSALLLAACSPGGGGGSGPAVSISFSSAALTVDEDTGSAALAVVLHAPAAGLESAVSALVVDAGEGNATPGEDYSAFAPLLVAFPAGSADGALQQVEIELLQDALVEGADETVVLSLSDPQGASVASPAQLVVTVHDVDEATLRFQSAATTTLDEQTQSYSVQVELALPAGVSLGVGVSAWVEDSGAGSAAAGSDYSAFAARTVEFSPASASGALQSVSLEVLDDSEIELDEDVRLALSQPSAGARISASAVHELTIRDDDTGGPAFLAASEGPTGVENPLTYDSPIALGSQQVGSGPNAGTLVRLSNLGGEVLALGAPDLSGSHPKDFAVEIESLSAAPPDPPEEPAVLGPDALAPLSDVLEDPLLGIQAALDVPALSELRALAAVTLHGFPLPGQGTVTLELRRLPLPLAPGAVLAVNGRPQPGGLRAALDGLTLWRGTVLERPQSRVFLALDRAGAQGFVELAHTPDRLVHVLSEVAAGCATELPRVRIALEGQLQALGRERPLQTCAGALELAGVPLPQPRPQGAPGVAALSAADCRLAVETDWQLCQKLGSASATTSYVTQLVAAVSDRYLTDVQTTLSIAYLGVYSDPGDPWTSQDGGGNAADLLDEFRNAWNSSGWPAPADLAHFVSGASLGGGIAYLNVLCNQGFGYGVSGNINGNINWAGWSGQKGSFTWDFVVVAHELGHNFAAQHTHSYCPPLDHCASNCNGSVVCSEGTLMSYCHTCAGGMNSIRLEFHPVSADFMRTAVNASCLGQSVLAGGDWVQYLVRFNPLGPSGELSADLLLEHAAANQPSPFRLKLSGTATD